MKKIYHRLLIVAATFAITLPLFAGKPTEAQILADLGSPTEKVVISALQDFEKELPTNAACLTKAKAMLTDARPLVREKAARVLGAIHADVNATDLKNIAALLESTEKRTVMQGLKALRGLKAQSTVPKIVPLLKNADNNIKRDACRTLAVIADKSVVKDIEPLLQDGDKAVVKDAADAIAALKNR